MSGADMAYDTTRRIGNNGFLVSYPTFPRTHYGMHSTETACCDPRTNGWLFSGSATTSAWYCLSAYARATRCTLMT
eukprot:1986258-Rhodomonas_salina.2